MEVASSKLVSHTPLAALWRDGATLSAVRGRRIGEQDIRALLRTADVSFAVANVGHPLQWFDGKARYALWKSELRPRLVPPSSDRFPLEDFPGERCYVATEWQAAHAPAAILFEMHH